MEPNATTCKSRYILIVVAGFLPSAAIGEQWSGPSRSAQWVWYGPFLLMGLIELSYGLGTLHVQGNGWNLLGLMTLIGAIALCCLPEMLLGKYRKQN